MTVWAQIVGGILAAAAIIAALAVIGKALMWLTGLFRRLSQIADDWLGEPPRPGFPEGRPGVFVRLASMEDTLVALQARLAAVEAQLHPNGGDSLRDAVDRIAEQNQPPA